LLNASYAWLASDGKPAGRPRLDAGQFGTSSFRRLYQTAVGWLCISAESENTWRRFLSVLSCDALTSDPTLATQAARLQHQPRVDEKISAALRTASAAEWSTRLDAAGVPNEICSETFALELFDDPELRRNRFVTGYPQPIVGYLEQLGVLFSFSDTPARIAGAPLVVGDNTREILRGVGYTNAELDELERTQVILDNPIVASSTEVVAAARRLP
jgi:crotonobetainyl-CoA:carnitine CoA-transferase CaiB-like acyl-CoA transferase